ERRRGPRIGARGRGGAMSGRPALGAGLLVAMACIAGCKSERSADPPVDPLIAGARISFPPGAPQLGLIGVEVASCSGASQASLFGKLVWNEDATARIFTPFAGRVRRVLVDAGEEVREGAPLAEVESPDFGEAQAEARTAESDFDLAESNLDR